MTERKWQHLDQEVPSRQEGPDRLVAYGYEIRSSALYFHDDVIYVQRKHTENRKVKSSKIDLSQCYLPPNKLNSNITKLKGRENFAKVVVAVVDGYLLRQQFTKSTAGTAISLANNVIRFLEYCWINNIYDLKNVKKEFLEIFIEKFTEGGWHKVLELERRSLNVPIDTLRMTRRKHKIGVVEYSCNSMIEAIGANISDSQVCLDYKKGDLVAKLKPARGAASPSTSSLTQIISHLNNLVDLPADVRVEAVVHESPYKFAVSVNAKESERTPNFDPVELSRLIAEAYRWVSEYADPIIKLLRTAYIECDVHEQDELDEARLFAVLDSPEREIVERLVGTRVTSVRRIGDFRKGIGLLGLLRVLYAACFILIGTFNGRRKDEIQDRSVGLHAEAFECLDESLGLYQGYFYCEKTTKDYRRFFINEITYKTLNTCKKISDVTWEVVTKNGSEERNAVDRKLFCIPPRAREKEPTWYDFSTDPGVDLLCQKATGSPNAVVPNAHMFRRAYAVVFYYRYENADLYALSQQLDHRDLAMTMHYVLDSASRSIEKHAAKLWGGERGTERARAMHSQTLADEVSMYSMVKLEADVIEILQGRKSIAGGFPKLVQRFARKMSGKIKYDDLELRTVTKNVVNIMGSRGHGTKPMRHGNCHAGPPKPNAGCFSKGVLNREMADIQTCGKCAYHQMKMSHLKAVEDDLHSEEKRLSNLNASSVRVAADLAALQSANELVEFYRERYAFN